MSDYAQDAADVDAAMREDGQLMTVTRKTPGAYVNGAVSIVTTTQTVWGIELGATAHDIGTVAGTLIQAGDRKMMVSAIAATGGALLAPKTGDTITAGGQVYSVKAVDKLSPGGVVVMWTIFGRI